MSAIIFVIISFFSPEIKSEQVAFDFFMKEIFINEYSDYGSVYFSGFTEKSNSLSAPFSKCFKSDKNLVDFFYKSRSTETDQLKLKTLTAAKIKFLKKSKTTDLKVSVYRAVEFNNNDYVYIMIYKTNEFVDHYIIKIENKKIIDHCKVSEII